MKIDRASFLLLTVSIAASACTSPNDDGASSANADITEGSKCFEDDDTPASIAEGTCFDLWVKGQELEFVQMTTVIEGGKTLAEIGNCVAASPSHPAAEGAQVCETFIGDFVLSMCNNYAKLYTKTAAVDAVTCLQHLENLADEGAIYACGFAALDKSCPGQATATETCAAVDEAYRTFSGHGLGAADKAECAKRAGGLRAVARQQLIDQAKGIDGLDMGSFHSALESIDVRGPRVGSPSEEGSQPGGTDPAPAVDGE